MVKVFDAAVGDMAIMADRCRYAEFSQPYVESGLVMVVKADRHQSQAGRLFLRPFTRNMWMAMAFMSLFTGFVVWLHEFDINPDFQLATILWFPIFALFFSHSKLTHYIVYMHYAHYVGIIKCFLR